VHYARLVRKTWCHHRAAGDILYDAHHSPDESQTILDRAESLIFHIAQQSDHSQIEALHDLLKQEMHRLELQEKGLITGVVSGFAELDELTTGFQKSEVIILAARPSMGKTAQGLGSPRTWPARHFPWASSAWKWLGKARRIACSRDRIAAAAAEMWNGANTCSYRCSELQDAPIFIDDTGLTLLQLRTAARWPPSTTSKHHRRFCSSPRACVENRQVEVSEMGRGVKALPAVGSPGVA
jgi:replicative DNA helicase